MEQNLEGNKSNTVVFYRMAYLGRPAQAVKPYVGSEYTQHNPAVGKGR